MIDLTKFIGKKIKNTIIVSCTNKILYLSNGIQIFIEDNIEKYYYLKKILGTLDYFNNDYDYDAEPKLQCYLISDLEKELNND